MQGSRKWRGVRAASIAAVAAAAFVMSLLVPSLSDTPAHANPSAGFNAANIIDDALFYDGYAWNPAQVQSFLNQRVPRCTIGDPGRAAGSAWGSTRIANSCLKDGQFTYASRAANAYCKAVAGGTRETAAGVIAKVAQACGISPKVLLVMLEKEQSLVTDSWPTVRQFDYAMGYACPDSGPGNSANCDPAQANFANQVYRSAWQIKVYRAFPNSYNYRPFQSNQIQWHPNAGCGTSNVYIENWATAALYIYTPYRPNQAALNAGWGTGDACSSYGNRNFYNFYTSWFGSTRGYTVWGDIAAYWTARSSEAGVYGWPTSSSVFRGTRFPQGVWVQSFAGGVITTEMNTGKTVGIPYGRIYDHWNAQMGGIYGAMGAPTSEPVSYAADGGAVLQWFQGGLTVSANATGTVASLQNGKVYSYYNDTLEGIYGALGYPVGSLTAYTGGSLQNFRRGFIAQPTGVPEPVHMTSGPLFDYYNGQAGGIYGRLGFPIANAREQAGALVQEFRSGYLVKPQSGGVLEVSGKEAEAHRGAASAGVDLGLPIAAKATREASGGSDYQLFESGIVVTPRATKTAAAIGGAVYSYYNSRAGGLDGPYGYPTGQQRTIPANGGSLQTFQHGIVFIPEPGAAVVSMRYDSPIYERYNGVEGGIYGWLGYPVAEEVRAGDGSRSQQFQNGRIRADAQGRTLALPDATLDRALQSGDQWGAQTGVSRAVTANGGAVLSFFKNALVTEVSGSGTVAALRYDSPIYERYNGVEGGIYGWLGYPVAEEVRAGDGSRSQQFQNGRLVYENGAVSTR